MAIPGQARDEAARNGFAVIAVPGQSRDDAARNGFAVIAFPGQARDDAARNGFAVIAGVTGNPSFGSRRPSTFRVVRSSGDGSRHAPG